MVHTNGLGFSFQATTPLAHIGFERLNAAVIGALEQVHSHAAEEPLDEVQPRRVGRVVQMDPRARREPGLDDRGLVGAVVVADQVDLQVLRASGLDLHEERLELTRSVAAVRAGDPVTSAPSNATNNVVVP